MVHPKVLENAGVDSKKYQGFAFGLGVERFAMIKYGILDIRLFHFRATFASIMHSCLRRQVMRKRYENFTAWLQKYFEQPLPSVEKLDEALTFHAFEIEEVSGDLLDVKVLPNRAQTVSHTAVLRKSFLLFSTSRSNPIPSVLLFR